MQGLLHLVQTAGPHVSLRPYDPRECVTIGRSSDAAIQLRGRTISRSHAEIRAVNGNWTVRDNNSKHGTSVNGAEIDPAAPAELTEGDSLTLGPWTFSVNTLPEDAEIPVPAARSAAPAGSRRVEPAEYTRTDPSRAALAAKLASITALDAPDVPSTLEAAEEVIADAFPSATVTVLPLDQAQDHYAADPTITPELVSAIVNEGVHIASTRQPGGRVPDTCAAPIHAGPTAVAVLLVRADTPPLDASVLDIAAAAQTLSARLTADRKRSRVAARVATEDARDSLRVALSGGAVTDRATVNAVYTRCGVARSTSGTVDVLAAFPHEDGSVTALLGSASGTPEGLRLTAAIFASCIDGDAPSALDPGHTLRALNRGLSATSDQPPLVDLALLALPPSDASPRHVSIAIAGEVNALRCRPADAPVAATRTATPPLGVDQRFAFETTHLDLRAGDRLALATASMQARIDDAETAAIDAMREILQGSTTADDDCLRLSKFLPSDDAPAVNDTTVLCLAYPSV